MGRSSGYCFKIIACGGSSESVDRDDLDASSENKVTNDKRGWSFRKKSSGHRVLSNTVNVITEIPSSDDKKSSEPVIISSEAIISEKTSTNQWTETEEFSRVSTSNTKDNVVTNLVTKAVDEDEIKFDSSPDESSIIIIQTAVRKFLAEREVLRHKNVVKFQAVVRGHLVRCRAAGTLRCIQAIVKMQTLVRARHSKISIKRLSIGEKGIQESNTKPHPTYISIEKLLSNRFANQLIQSTPRTKQINIKFKPLTTAPTPPVSEAEPPKRPAKRAATEQADSEGRKSVFGSRKTINPSFIAAQSKFEELTSKTTTEPPPPPAAPKTAAPPVYESLKVVRTAGSECGTELSVTSMLDSPDPSESENIETTESTHDLLGTELTHSITIPPETNNIIINQITKSPLEPELERTPSSERKSSSDVKPRSERKASSEKEKEKEKPKMWSNSKKLMSPISRGNLENLPKEGKSGKRRNSFGSQSSEIDHQEARDSSYSNSNSNSNYIPSYMQVTESARAKALNSSPRLSPDVKEKEKDAYLKKRHSMPGAVNSRHDSPRLKRSSPQSQQGQQTTKGNESRERKWQT
ncbi:unnamed protein product [Lactuca virosa]|uniref:DUF4005 domain-containing protein n=1 Tax=Lactuca virosa TaxID=75947 RepID=A0AAU9NBA8_9ASTR|nr:unnamed protein product [Lactuca virosa]